MEVLKLWELGTLSLTHQTEVLEDGRHVAKNGADSESSWSCLRVVDSRDWNIRT